MNSATKQPNRDFMSSWNELDLDELFFDAHSAINRFLGAAIIATPLLVLSEKVRQAVLSSTAAAWLGAALLLGR